MNRRERRALGRAAKKLPSKLTEEMENSMANNNENLDASGLPPAEDSHEMLSRIKIMTAHAINKYNLAEDEYELEITDAKGVTIKSKGTMRRDSLHDQMRDIK